MTGPVNTDGERPCLMCGDSRQVPDEKSWKYYPEDRPCPRCTDGTWEHADRLVASAIKARRAETHSGSVGDESATLEEGDAQEPSPNPDRQSDRRRGMSETWESIAEWCDETFGPASPIRMASRANEEMAELIDKASRADTYSEDVLIEAADVVICLARFPGIWTAVERKMAVNRGRAWRLTGEGTGYHIADTGR